jgi:hypothetical protein
MKILGFHFPVDKGGYRKKIHLPVIFVNKLHRIK